MFHPYFFDPFLFQCFDPPAQKRSGGGSFLCSDFSFLILTHDKKERKQAGRGLKFHKAHASAHASGLQLFTGRNPSFR
jgi:hypothetical protein